MVKKLRPVNKIYRAIREVVPSIMILTCPNCQTRYTLQASQLPPGGRNVRCAACRTTWHAERQDDPIDLPLSRDLAPARPEDLSALRAKELPGQYRAMVEDKKRLEALTAQGIVWGALGVVVVLILGLGFLLRVDIVRAFPRIAGAYAMVGVPVNATGLQLTTKDGGSKTNFKNGRFVVTVTAQVTNLRDKPTPVPPIKVKLLDSTLQTFDNVTIPGSGLVVEPHATRTLTFDVRDPKNMVAHLDLDFDVEGMKKSKPRGASARTHDSDHATDGAEGDTQDTDTTQTDSTGPEHTPDRASDQAGVATAPEQALSNREPQAMPANEYANDIADTAPANFAAAPPLRDHHS